MSLVHADRAAAFSQSETLIHILVVTYVQETQCISVAILCSPNHANKLLWKMNYISQQISLMKSVRPFAWIFDTSGCALARDTWGGGGGGSKWRLQRYKALNKEMQGALVKKAHLWRHYCILFWQRRKQRSWPVTFLMCTRRALW